ncbi:MAG: DUF3310 domain-containing protein [Planctomycetes bacterium]|nr:DUF3310 domain-containing protein [Planctomycetota bacterium]
MNSESHSGHDPVARPHHYTFGAIEVIDAIEAWGCDFVEGNIIKYVARWKHKDGVTDLRKAAWYLKRLIDRETNNDSAG